MESSVTKPKRRKQRPLRPVHRETRHVFLRNLACFQEVHEKLLDGWTTQDIVRFVQTERGEATDISEQALHQRIREYRDDLPPALLASRRMSQYIGNAVERVRQGIDELAELENLYRLQMERVNIDFTHEKNMKKLLPSVTQEIRTAREILGSIADLKMDLGLNNRHLGTVGIDAHLTAHVEEKFGSSEISAVFANPERRQRLLGVASALMRRAGNEVIEAEAEEVKEAVESAEELPAESNVEASKTPVESEEASA